ncbi:Tab2/Atab2 family RNA-binding protein [Coleofasciculus sp. FACHB-SPT9]|uniref:Tab2/Atab2 family RNA-binding protein n=1 Tax=Cyanophyceae TaxID=3028117 RepID=UPI0016836DF8|nr:Tab2/Atab2 family RNA-binding protein [Coleofasciculus sp. FACHB-SPT9]MBD1888323.1 Tab2/Atab2 family RNA-binding protein [Coleofasciculus sp. FACHB-SPT9]
MGTVWELDFYSRPILDEQQKKIWELLVCESPLDIRTKPESLFRYAEFCPNSTVNSIWLRTTLEEAIARAAEPPQKIRFFRRPMTKMIVKACDELGISAQLSRRTFTLYRWLQERMQDVYPQQPGYQGVAPNPSVQYQPQPPQPLPDALVGQKWAFVTLSAEAFEEMHEWDIGFREAFPLIGLGDFAPLLPETQIPGVVIFSPRAVPMAGWMSGIEPAFLKFNRNTPPRLLLETGESNSWILASIKDSKTLTEAENFEDAKRKAGMLHFLAIQSDPQSESFAGFWLMQELPLS